jgi:hypothetical protein
MINTAKTEAPRLREVIDTEIFKYCFILNELLRNKPSLTVVLLWPNGDYDVLCHHKILSGQITLTHPLSTLTSESILNVSKKLSSKKLIVKSCRVSNNDIVIETEKNECIKYYTNDLPDNIDLEGEAAAIFLYGVRNYYWPYQELLIRKCFNQQDLKEFLTVYPQAGKFTVIGDLLHDLFLGDQKTRGQRSYKYKDDLLAYDYAIYNLIKNKKSDNGSIFKAIDNLCSFIMKDFDHEEDYYSEALRKAFFRAKKKIESSEFKPGTNLVFLSPTGYQENMYLLLVLPPQCAMYVQVT